MKNKAQAPARFKFRDLGLGLFGLAVIILILVFVFLGARNILYNSNYFRIKEVITTNMDIDLKGDRRTALSYLKGRNIFSIDLGKESSRLSEFFPECKRIDLAKVLPNRVFIYFVKRKPAAYVKLYRYFIVDEEAALFYASNQSEDRDLPVILGLDTKIFGPKLGKQYNIRELRLALNIIKEASALGCGIKKINVSALNNASIILSFLPKAQAINGPIATGFSLLEVRLGADNIKSKIAILADLIKAQGNDLSNIKYIDLRFKEPVIKFNDAKTK